METKSSIREEKDSAEFYSFASFDFADSYGYGGEPCYIAPDYRAV